jgi:hypothetical protein
VYFAERQMFRYKGARDLITLAHFATEGYKEDKEGGEAVPALPSWWDIKELVKTNDFLRTLADDFEHIVQKRKNAAALLVVIGVVVGMFFGLLLGGGGGGKKTDVVAGNKSKKE